MPIENVVYRQREAGQVAHGPLRLPRARAATRRCARPSPRWTATRPSTPSCARACAAAAAPASRWAARPASSRRTRRCPPTSCATPTRASRAPSRTASSWRPTPSSCWRGSRIAGYAIGAVRGYIYIRGEYEHQARVLDDAIAPGDARPAFLGQGVAGHRLRLRHHALPRRRGVHLRRGDRAAREPRGQARPAAAQAALPGGGRPLRLARRSSTTSRRSRRCPPIVEHGADWYAAMGTEKSTGTKVFSISGHVMKPGNYEIVMHDTTLRELVYDIAGGFRAGPRVRGRLGRRLERQRASAPRPSTRRSTTSRWPRPAARSARPAAS